MKMVCQKCKFGIWNSDVKDLFIVENKTFHKCIMASQNLRSTIGC